MRYFPDSRTSNESLKNDTKNHKDETIYTNIYRHIGGYLVLKWDAEKHKKREFIRELQKLLDG
jgi:hypothetical protein